MGSARDPFARKNLKWLEKFVAERLDRFKRHERVAQRCGMSQHASDAQAYEAACVLMALKIQPPMSLCCVLSAWLNDLTLGQQLMLKLASAALTLEGGPRPAQTFSKPVLLLAAQLLDAFPDAQAETDFASLEQLGFVRAEFGQEHESLVSQQQLAHATVFAFSHPLLPHVLRLRTLTSQRVEAQRLLARAKEQHERQVRLQFLAKARGKLSSSFPVKQGMVMVLKNCRATPGAPADAKTGGAPGGSRLHRRRHSLGSVWKRRYACLFADRIDFYQDETRKRKTGSTFLEGSSVTAEDAPVDGRGGVVRLDAHRWVKLGGTGLFGQAQVDELREPCNTFRSFYISPVELTAEEVEDWLYKIKLAIEATAAKEQLDALQERQEQEEEERRQQQQHHHHHQQLQRAEPEPREPAREPPAAPPRERVSRARPVPPPRERGDNEPPQLPPRSGSHSPPQIPPPPILHVRRASTAPIGSAKAPPPPLPARRDSSASSGSGGASNRTSTSASASDSTSSAAATPGARGSSVRPPGGTPLHGRRHSSIPISPSILARAASPGDTVDDAQDGGGGDDDDDDDDDI